MLKTISKIRLTQVTKSPATRVLIWCSVKILNSTSVQQILELKHHLPYCQHLLLLLTTLTLAMEFSYTYLHTSSLSQAIRQMCRKLTLNKQTIPKPFTPIVLILDNTRLFTPELIKRTRVMPMQGECERCEIQQLRN